MATTATNRLARTIAPFFKKKYHDVSFDADTIKNTITFNVPPPVLNIQDMSELIDTIQKLCPKDKVTIYQSVTITIKLEPK